MRLVLKRTNLNESKRKIDSKLRKVFKYSDEFLKSLNKPGKETFIRFSKELPGGDLLLTPNISSYSSGYTPIAIYGYPIKYVKDKLISQKLGMSHYKYIIVYWVDSSTIINLNSINKTDLVNLIDQIISIIGKEKYIESIKKWSKVAKAEYRTQDELLANSLLSKDGSVATVDDKAAPTVFWNIVSNYGTSANKTVLLSKLRLKQVDSEGKPVEKNFSTVIDTGAIIDPVPAISETESFSVQGFTLSSKFIDDYEFFENPAAIIPRKRGKKLPDKQKLPKVNADIFENEKNSYIEQISPAIQTTLKSKVTFEQISNGVKINFKLPGKKSVIDTYLATYLAKNPDIDRKKFIEYISNRLVDHLNKVNGKKAYSERISFEYNFYKPGLQTTPSGDVYSITIEYPSVQIHAQQVYSIVYFAYYVYGIIAKNETLNPFSFEGDYKSYMKPAAQSSRLQN